MSAHGPTPWTTRPGNNYVAAQVWTDDGLLIANVYGQNPEHANECARVMAVAPELLEAARATLKLWEDWQNTPFARLDITWVGEPPAVKLARAAIEKYEARAA